MSIDDIRSHVKRRYRGLPAEARKQAKQEKRRAFHNRYMRTVYRKARKFLNVVLTLDQYARLQKNARAAGRAPTALLREAAFAYFDQRFVLPSRLASALRDLTGQLRAIGNSINQIAHRVNTKKHTDERDIRECRELLLRIERDITRFVTEPPRAA